eukprot:9377915-Pyramimonas_sp.AAC.1
MVLLLHRIDEIRGHMALMILHPSPDPARYLPQWTTTCAPPSRPAPCPSAGRPRTGGARRR